ncbi:DUF4188 domain-containing protein [Novosphingobium flavum]|uniref:DUF4188 domain-containing protein n=1 Tax=Novosphingobium flavum TaxID=1778672 RepID=A0A7X1FQC5_9SPHN|nr:DUF4188 domain-containing protein [Novosphingobium flavum]MBC2664884.1 DUF4188 domain-containing protein [Novosphingobium flavum]
MGKIVPGRMTAAYQGPLVVFVIGMRINRWRQIGKWWPLTRLMEPMIAELKADPESGFLGAETMLSGLRTVVLLQYWRDFDSLETYARARDKRHWPAWAAFNKAVGKDGSVGVFHETYVVADRGSETVYVNMPAFGLGKVGGLVPATGSREAARSRMKGEAEG